MDERVINFCRAPSGLWVGWIVKDNAHYWGSGRTMDDMVRHVKNTLYIAKKCPTRGYYIASKQSQMCDAPIATMGKSFKTRAWFGGLEKANAAVEKAVTEPVVEESAPEYDYYETETVDGTLTVFGIIRRKVATYNLGEPKKEPTDEPDDTPSENTQRVVIEVPKPAPVTDIPEGMPLPAEPGMVLFSAEQPTADWKPREDLPTE